MGGPGGPLCSLKLVLMWQQCTVHNAAVPNARMHCWLCVVMEYHRSLVCTQVRAGHGAGKPTEKVIEEAADTYGFAAEVVGASWELQEFDSEPKKASSSPYAEQRML